MKCPYTPSKPIVEEPTLNPEWRCASKVLRVRMEWQCVLEGGHEGGHYMMTNSEYNALLFAS